MQENKMSEDTRIIMKLGDAYSNPKNYNANGRGTVYNPNGIVATLTTMSGGQ